MHKEIEIKIKVDCNQEQLIKYWLDENSKFIGQYKINDYYLNNPKNSFYTKSKNGYIEALNSFRVRVTNDGNFITFKKRHIDENDKTLSVDELETNVGDGDKSLKMFENLGLLEITEIQKKRSVYLYDIFEFAFDQVENMGDFLEIELKNYNGHVKEGIEKIYNLLKLIGIRKFIQYDRGYITMFLNPDHYFGQKIEI